MTTKRPSEDDSNASSRKKQKIVKEDISRNLFLARAPVVSVSFDDHDASFTVIPKEFSSGSVGWNFCGRAGMPLGDGRFILCQTSLNCVANGSKEWPEGETEIPTRDLKASSLNASAKAQNLTMTRQQFEGVAKDITMTFNSTKITLKPKNFSTGASGWFANARPVLSIYRDDEDAGGPENPAIPVACTLSMNCTVLNSKDWEDGGAEEDGTEGEDQNDEDDEEGDDVQNDAEDNEAEDNEEGEDDEKDEDEEESLGAERQSDSTTAQGESTPAEGESTPAEGESTPAEGQDATAQT